MNTSSITSKIHYDLKLPIFEKREAIIQALKTRQVLIVAGETGSGKTTQLPLMCLEAGLTANGMMIGCTQPRRIAATSVARYVASQLNSPIGSIVGYKIRFDEKCSRHSKIKFMTDGITLTEISHDPLLRQYSTLIIDEAHERSLNIDFLLGYIRRILPKRPDLRVIISSATIDTETFSKAFNNAPIIEVSGRLFPVEVIYEPVDVKSDETYVDAAVRITGTICDMDDAGDILVFMPTERDIREASGQLSLKPQTKNYDILPLFGRLSTTEQNRIFQPSSQRKIIIATNIAETSITVPGIRFVVDTGLARMMQYLPHLRTSSMPVDVISKASITQRTGRAGRVQDGVCFRLFDRDDYDSRPDFTQPEIQRTNLAGVILQLKSLGLGDVDNFPFIQPPSSRAVTDGYQQLSELGALDQNKNLTKLGREMAKLPFDPQISRIIFQSRDEHALKEVKIIASGLSIVDPRERPFEKQAMADEAHKRFIDPKSDFLTYLKLWDANMQEWEHLGSQRKMRKFCHDHFLSFNRMREWHDVHEQLHELCNPKNGFPENSKPATYDAIHRSLLSGLLSNIASKTEEGSYRGTRGRELLIFPGSSLHKKGHPWIVCHQIVETSRVFARTAAAIDPGWIESLAPHLCRYSYSEPYFDEETGSVRAREQVTFFGLSIIKSRPVFYGRINPVESNKLFIDQGLIEGRLQSHHPFIKHNKGIIDKIYIIEAKLRTRRLFAGEPAIAGFYQKKMPTVTSIHDLNREIKEHGNDNFLRMEIDDLLTEKPADDPAKYPDSLLIAGKPFPLLYQFKPGEPDDGATLIIPESILTVFGDHSLEWALPVIREPQVSNILSNVPKGIRNSFFPYAEHAHRLSKLLKPSEKSIGQSLSESIKKEYGIDVNPGLLSLENCEPHLRLRVIVTFDDGHPITEFRVPQFPEIIVDKPHDSNLPAINKIKKQWAVDRAVGWTFGDLPERIAIEGDTDIPLYSYPAVNAKEDSVDLVLLGSSAIAGETHTAGVQKLLELSLADQLAWLEKEIKPDKQTLMRCVNLANEKQIRSALVSSILNDCLTNDYSSIRNQAAFDDLLMKTKQSLNRALQEASPTFAKIIESYADCMLSIDRLGKTHPARLYQEIRHDLSKDCKAYIQKIFHSGFRYSTLVDYPRYLAAFKKRIEIAFDTPSRYHTNMELIRKYQDQSGKFGASITTHRKVIIDGLKQMIEEFAISLFAQQSVKTKFPVSEKRLDQKLDEVRELSTD